MCTYMCTFVYIYVHIHEKDSINVGRKNVKIRLVKF